MLSSPAVRPSKIVGVGLNYRSHSLEVGKALPAEPLIFLKPPSAVIGPGEPIRLPAGSLRVEYEGELAVVIGTRAHRLGRAEALGCVAGYTCLNDVSARELQARDRQWTRAKGFDTFCPVGPRVAPGLDPTRLRLVTRVNGVVRQDASTADMVFDVAALIEFISGVMTLEPGDLIATGTPAGVGPLAPGDLVEVEIEGIGVLANPVIAG